MSQIMVVYEGDYLKFQIDIVGIIVGFIYILFLEEKIFL